jgi:hypothetical protein
MQALGRRAADPGVESHRRTALGLLLAALTVGLGGLLVPAPYALLRARGLSATESIFGVAMLCVTGYVLVTSLYAAITPPRSPGLHRAAGVVGVISGISVLVYWIWFFVVAP